MDVNGFRFLTMEEFSCLARRDKAAYLDAAIAKVEESKREVTKRSLFKDGASETSLQDSETGN